MYAAVPFSGSGRRWGGSLGVAFTVARKKALRPIHVRDETKELKILRNAFRPVLRREHVVPRDGIYCLPRGCIGPGTS